MSLKRWFKEKWVDVKTGEPCGRKKGDGRPYPACRPTVKVNKKTPKTTGDMSKEEKERFKKEKTGPKNITYQHRKKNKERKKLRLA